MCFVFDHLLWPDGRHEVPWNWRIDGLAGNVLLAKLHPSQLLRKYLSTWTDGDCIVLIKDPESSLWMASQRRRVLENV